MKNYAECTIIHLDSLMTIMEHVSSNLVKMFYHDSFWLTFGKLMPYPWHHTLCVVCKCANVHHIPGLCPLGIGGTPNISHKIKNHIFTFLTQKPPACGASYYAGRFPNHNLIKL